MSEGPTITQTVPHDMETHMERMTFQCLYCLKIPILAPDSPFYSGKPKTDGGGPIKILTDTQTNSGIFVERFEQVYIWDVIGFQNSP